MTKPDFSLRRNDKGEISPYVEMTKPDFCLRRNDKTISIFCLLGCYSLTLIPLLLPLQATPCQSQGLFVTFFHFKVPEVFV
jgi:hypothetical protein